ncbi:RNA-binding domain-containing protein [Xylariaceae sp. FL0594]|nr:RNA-binding domain-containing protein [Xylariaceae sp. FL0594]
MSTAESVAAPVPAPAPAPKWRDGSSWRRSEPSTQTSAPTQRPSRFNPARTPGASWRDRQEKSSTDGGQGSGNGDTSRQVVSDDFIFKSRPYDRLNSVKTPQKDDEAAAKAIAEGRRIYIGNLRYQAKPEDIESLLAANDLSHFSNIHISIDPFTGRNPSYCFVEFPDAESAKTAMEVLEGKELLGREVKCRPCQPKGSGSGGRPSEAPSRWGHWSGDKDSRDQSKPSSFDRYRQDFSGKRLYVGGLPRMLDQATNFSEMTELFAGFKIEAISKRVSAHEKTREQPGNHDYCFVDFATAEQAKEAMESLNGTIFKGEQLKVSPAKGRSNKWQERDSLDGKRGFHRHEQPARE